MPKFIVTARYSFQSDFTIEAKSAEEAEKLAQEITFSFERGFECDFEYPMSVALQLVNIDSDQVEADQTIDNVVEVGGGDA